MKTYNETIDSVLKRRDEYETNRQKRSRKIKTTIIPLTCSFAVALAAVGVCKSGILSKEPPIVPIETTAPVLTTKPAAGNIASPQITDNWKMTQAPETIIQNPETTKTNDPAISQPSIESPSTTGNVSADSPDQGYSTGIGYFFIPALPANREIITTGEKITDEEAAAYFAEHRASMISSLSSSGVAADAIKISDKGYSHVTYNGTEGERLEVRVNFRDYLVYNGNALVAIITLYKENGMISDTPMFGASWFEPYNVFLQEHAGEELVYIYAGQAEIILTPHGSMYAPLGFDPTKYMEGIEAPYQLFYHPDDVYIP